MTTQSLSTAPVGPFRRHNEQHDDKVLSRPLMAAPLPLRVSYFISNTIIILSGRTRSRLRLNGRLGYGCKGGRGKKKVWKLEVNQASE